jgi:hypothetical protein
VFAWCSCKSSELQHCAYLVKAMFAEQQLIYLFIELETDMLLKVSSTARACWLYFIVL